MHQVTAEQRAMERVRDLDARIRNPIATETLNRLAAFFATRNHHPSEAQWAALTDLARTLEAMANGTAAPKFYLSSLDPGVGKSQTLVHFIDVLLASSAHEHVGILICVSRLSEVERFVENGGIPKEMLCVRTRSDRHNAMGMAEEDAARVVITTQQMVEKQLRGRAFNTSGLFPFHGEPRKVRIWDEAMLPGEGVTVNRARIAGLLDPAMKVSPALSRAIDAVQIETATLDTGATYDVPNFEEEFGHTTLLDVLGRCETDSQRATINALWHLSGKTASICKDGDYQTALDYKETLPNDLAPMVILDASGRVRTAYRDMEVERRTLAPLASAPKLYDRLTVNVWGRGGGKGSFKKDAQGLCLGIAKTVDTKPSERWLIVCHKPGDKIGDTEHTVRSLLTNTPQEAVQFITWGNHSATNEFADVPNVILAGTLFYPDSGYEALKRLAAGRRPADGKVTATEMHETKLGEHAHLILQALCRGSVRKCNGPHCHKAEAWIIAAKASGIRGHLPTIFPGCLVKAWRPIPRGMEGLRSTVFDYVTAWATTAKVGAVLRFKDIQKSLGVTSREFQDQTRRGTDGEGLRDALGEIGVEEHGNKLMTSYRKAWG